MKHRRMFPLYLFYFVYFCSTGLTMYTSRYLGGVGLSNGQIGVITAVPAFVSIFAQPLWGMISDRSPKKKYTIIAGLALSVLFAFAAHFCGGNYLPLLLIFTLLNTMTLPVSPVGNSIAIEHAETVGASYGPVRMSGTIGYQFIILAAGFFFTEKLDGYFIIYGVTLLATALCGIFLPATKGHQHGAAKIPLHALLKNLTLMLMLALTFIVQVVAQFYNAFYTKYMGDLGVSTSVTGIVTTLTVVMEIPFLIFLGDRIKHKLSIFRWMWLGLFINGLRFIALSFARTPAIILLTQLPSVVLFACFEFFPVLHLSEIVDKELVSSAQSVFQMVSFGLARIVGTLVGGFLAEGMGIGPVFRLGGAMLLAVALVGYVPLWRRMRD